MLRHWKYACRAVAFLLLAFVCLRPAIGYLLPAFAFLLPGYLYNAVGVIL